MPNSLTHRKAPTIRSMWLRETLRVVVLFVLVGAVAVTASAFQRSAFRDTTNDLQRANGAVVALRTALNRVDDSSSAVMYGLSDPVENHRATYDRDSRAVTAAFEHLRSAVPAASQPLVEHARESWESMRKVVEGATALQESGEARKILEAGKDPFKDAWTNYGHINDDLAEVERANVLRLRVQADRVDRVQGQIPIVLAFVTALALGAIALSARRMSRRIVTPLAELRRAALAMRDAEVYVVADVDHASAELQVLAQTIQETATTLRESHSELREHAYTDMLTALPNRKAFVEELERRFAEPNEGLGVLFVDLDDFKVVNDSLGHGAGDALLAIVATRLRAAVRQEDLVARLGGDEFAVLVSYDHDAVVATHVAENVLAAMAGDVMLGDTLVPVDCSIGVATSAGGAESADALLRNADFAMYTAKGRGKNCVETFAQSMQIAVHAQSEFKYDLSRAAMRGELLLHHQPVLDLAEGRVLGFEALVRWQHPVRGLVPPMDFIPLAEETGDIVAIGTWVLGQACEDLVDYRRDHGRDDLWMSVNVSPLQLMSPGFVDVVLDTLAIHGLPPAALVLEITEHAAVSNTSMANAVLEALRGRGVRIALDDFGVGFSSLRYLCELPVDVIKIDRSFVAETGSDRGDAMLSSIVSLARKMHLAVIAEGIENQAQLHRLQKLGPLAGQGFLFARPMPVETAGLALRDESPAAFAAGAYDARYHVPEPRGADAAMSVTD